MEAQKQRHILLSVTGLTPQIITETLYALTQLRGERVDEIRVITTLVGRDKIKEELLDKRTGKFFSFCREYNIDPESISFNEGNISLLPTADKKTLKDIRSEEDNESAANEISEIVRRLTEDPNTQIHASAAGGRKTMSIYLTAAMQLFGRNQDRLSHVLVSEDFETLSDFYYIPRVPCELKDRHGNSLSTDKAQIHLANIPFIRLRGVMSGWIESERGHSYSEMVRRAQEDLDFIVSEYDLQIDLRRKKVFVGSRAVNLTERELFFFTMFAIFRAKSEGTDGAKSLKELTHADFDMAFRRITAARGDEVGIEECTSYPRFSFLNELVQQINTRREKDLKDFTDKLLVTNARIKGKFEEKGLPEQYMIGLRDLRGLSRYGLSIAAKRIKFIPCP